MLLSKIFSSKQTWDVTAVGLNHNDNTGISACDNYRVMLEQNDRDQCGCMLENEGEMCGCRMVKRLRIRGRPGLSDVKISFDDHATTTFEYEGEEAALETYLEEHPDEKEEAESVNIVNGVTETSDAHLMNDSPAVPLEPETHMKSNTVLGTSGGGLTSYKSKIQTQDFQFGMSPEPEVTYSMPELEQEEPESIDLLPADDNELDAFSAEVDKADMLF
ncbi:uncharacterized protein LOC128546151 isoform X2 [Mercenaria mercenaria]|uniref:uncharacterized protein LOC128546151 isoform X2 n=1 Tax=Mercenaria mercenaria TaxID=6596 RepID=UPI00234E9907|nr:uncharacterized protein LOC128546151 isoform X2 [Mercenaria mercenaria]